MQEAVITATVRTPIGRATSGALKDTRPDDLAALVVQAVLQRVPDLDPAEVEDVIPGCAIPEGQQGMNIGRIAAPTTVWSRCALGGYGRRRNFERV